MAYPNPDPNPSPLPKALSSSPGTNPFPNGPRMGRPLLAGSGTVCADAGRAGGAGGFVSIAYAKQLLTHDVWQGVTHEPKLTVAEIIRLVPSLPDRFWTHGIVCINDTIVPREMWHVVRPKPFTSDGVPVVVNMLMAPGRGAKGTSTKNIITIVASIAVLAAATFITGGGLSVLAPGIFAAAGTFGAGGLGAALAGAAVSAAGLLAIQALTPPPTKKKDDREKTSESAAADGNVLEPGASIPRIVGTRKIFPPFMARPLIEIVGEDEIVEAIYGLAGPHKLEDIRVDGSPITQIPEVQFDVREGWDNDTPITMIGRYSHTSEPQVTLTDHTTQPAAQTQLENQSNPEASIPQWHTVTTRKDPDQIWLQMYWPEGIIDTDNVTTNRVLPVRIRMRPIGTTTWLNLPEIQFKGKKQKLYRKAIILKWATPGALPALPTDDAPILAFWSVPTQAVAPIGIGGWTAHTTFSGGAPINSMANIALFQDRVEIFLNHADFIRGVRWEVQVKRGYLYTFGSLNVTTYALSEAGGSIVSLFDYRTVATIHQIDHSKNGVTATTVLARVVSIWDRHPIATIGLALIAIRGRNRNIGRLSILASGYVPDYSGVAGIWDSWTITSNPAPHFRWALTGVLNAEPMPEDLIDDPNLVDWRLWCATNAHTADIVLTGNSLGESLDLIASCGRARRRMSETWGVVIDRPRATEPPIQIFSPRNSNNFSADKPFAKVPDAFQVAYINAADDYQPDEVIVYNPDIDPGDAVIFEALDYDGIVDTGKVTDRAIFDFRVLNERASTYSLQTDIETLVCRRGDVIGINHDVIDIHMYYARVKSVQISGPNVTGITLDTEVGIDGGGNLFTASNLFTLTSLFITGRKIGSAIRLQTGALLTKEVNADPLETATLVFTTPFTDTGVVIPGLLVVIGTQATEFGRYLVFGIEYGGDFVANLTVVDEAPSIHELLELLSGDMQGSGEYLILSGDEQGKLLLSGT